MKNANHFQENYDIKPLTGLDDMFEPAYKEFINFNFRNPEENENVEREMLKNVDIMNLTKRIK